MTRRGAAPLLAVLFLATLVPPSAGSEPSGAAAWWGPAGESAWHARALLSVTNAMVIAIENVPVRWDVQIPDLLAAAGWPMKETGSRKIPRDFTLDPTSWRVIEYTSAGAAGLPKPHDNTLEGHERYVLPSTFLPGAGSTSPYDNATNPVGRLTWLAPGSTRPGETRIFFVYFDAQENPAHAPTPHDPQDLALVQAQGYISRGTTLFGYGQEVTVSGLHEGTDVTILSYGSSSHLVNHTPPKRSPVQNPFPVSAGTSTKYPLGGQPVPFVVLATKPILARGNVSGFAPSTDAQLAGTRFQLTPTSGTLYLIATTASPTTVEIKQGAITSRLTLSPWAQIDGLSTQQDVQATLVSGGPFLVQDGVPSQPAQIPSADGAPTGVRALGARSPQANRFWVTSIQHEAVATVRSDQANVQLAPRGSDATPLPPPERIAHGETWTAPFLPGDPTTPIEYEASSPVVVFAGYNDPRLASTPGDRNGPSISSAIGGINGNDFRIPLAGAYSIFAYHDNTRLDIRTGSTPAQRIVLNELDRFDLTTTSNASVASDQPIAILPRSHIGYLPGMMPSLDVTLLDVEARGSAIVLTSLDSSTEPVIKSAPPGNSATFRLQVQNYGDQAETIALKIANSSTDWQSEFIPDSLQLQGGESATVDLVIDVPAEGTLGKDMRFTIKAVAQGNPRLGDSVHAVVATRTIYGVSLAVGQPGGPKTLSTSLADNETMDLTLAITNTGSARDNFSTALTFDTDSFQPRFIQPADFDGNVSLESGESTSLVMRVSAPAMGGSPIATLQLDAQSTANAAAADRLVLTLGVRQARAIQAKASSPIAYGEPGENATISINVTNAGNLPTDLAFDIQAVGPAFWMVPTLRYDGTPITEINGLEPSRLAGDLELELHASIPRNATAFSQSLVRVTITERDIQGNEVGTQRLDLVIVANRILHFDVAAPSTTGVAAGRTTPLALTITHLGNGVENLTLHLTGLPEGWRASPIALPALAPNASLPASIPLRAPANSPAGTREATLEIRAQTQLVQRVPLVLEVAERPDPQAKPAPGLLLPAGLETLVPLTITNDGNSLGPIQIDLELPAGWETNAPTTLSVAPGRQAEAHLVIHPPASASGRHEVAIVLTQANTTTRVPLPMQVEPTVVQLGQTSVTPTSDAALIVAVEVRNVGRIDARSLTLDLLSGNERIDRVSFDNLPANTTRIATFKARSESADALRILLDADKRFPTFAHETLDVSNVKETPHLPLIWLLVVFAAATGYRTRRYAKGQQRILINADPKPRENPERPSTRSTQALDRARRARRTLRDQER